MPQRQSNRSHGGASTRLAMLFSALLLLSVVRAGHECSGHGKRHGNHCHCEKGYKSQGTECVSTQEAASRATCAPGGIAWELSMLLFLEKATYTVKLVNNTENMATLILPVANPTTESMMQMLDQSIELSSQRVEDVALPRKAIKKGQVMAPSANVLYVVMRNDADEVEARKGECEKTPGNTWHIDHCDGPEGHGQMRRSLGANGLAGPRAVMSVDLTVTSSGYYAVHLQHNAMEEFQMKILQADGTQVHPVATKAAPEEAQDPQAISKPHRKATGSVWIKTMFSVLIVALLSVVGILLLAIRSSLLNRLMDGFVALSGGALFGAAFIHILPESIEFYSTYGQMELTLCMVFTAGFAIAMVVEMLLAVWIGKVATSCQEGNPHDETLLDTERASIAGGKPSAFVDMAHLAGEPNSAASLSSPGRSKWSLRVTWSRIKPMAYIILIGDLFHNFVDGILIATAFLACDDALGIAVTGSAVLHEIPQEFADFIILLDSGFTTFQAVVFNFLSALSAFLGAIVILCAVKVTSETMGLLLGFGAGTLVYIAATDLLPRVLEVKTITDFCIRLVLFGVGVGVLGLTTLYHVHCNADL